MGTKTFYIGRSGGAQRTVWMATASSYPEYASVPVRLNPAPPSCKQSGVINLVFSYLLWVMVSRRGSVSAIGRPGT